MKVKIEKDGEIIERKPFDGQNFDEFYTTDAVVRYAGHWYSIRPIDDGDKEAEYILGTKQSLTSYQ